EPVSRATNLPPENLSASIAHQHGAPGKTAAECFHQDQLATLYPAVANADVERHRHRCRGRVAMVLHCQDDFLHRHFEPLCGGLDNTQVRLVRYEPVDLILADVVRG